MSYSKPPTDGSTSPSLWDVAYDEGSCDPRGEVTESVPKPTPAHTLLEVAHDEGTASSGYTGKGAKDTSPKPATPAVPETGFFEGQFINPRTENIIDSFLKGSASRICIKGGSVLLGCIAGKAAYDNAMEKSQEDGKTHPMKALMYAVPATVLFAGGLLMRGEAKIHK